MQKTTTTPTKRERIIAVIAQVKNNGMKATVYNVQMQSLFTVGGTLVGNEDKALIKELIKIAN